MPERQTSELGGRWWWHAPKSRCLGVRPQRFHHPRLSLAAGIGVAALLIGWMLVQLDSSDWSAIDSIGSAGAVWLVAAVVLQAASMATFALLQRRVLADAGLRVSARSALAMAYAGNAVAVTIPFAGTTASAAFTYHQYVQRGATGTMASWAMAVSGVFSTLAFAMLIGIAALANGNPAAAGAGIASLVLAMVPIVVLAVARRSRSARERLERFAVWALALTKRVIARPRGEPADVVANAIVELSSYRLRRPNAVAVVVLASMNWTLDALCLWAVLQAFAVSLPLRSLPFVYAVAIAAASVGFTPAGIGTVEAAIAVALTNFGSDASHGLLAALVYRGISTWLVMLVGWIVLVTLRRGGDITGSARTVTGESPL